MTEPTLIEIAQGVLREVAAAREEYCKAWVAETGLLPSDATLVSQIINNEGKTKLWIEKNVQHCTTHAPVVAALERQVASLREDLNDALEKIALAERALQGITQEEMAEEAALAEADQ